MFYEKDMKLWDVCYTDKYGNRQLVRYCAVSKSDAMRLFKSEQERGEVLKSITEYKKREIEND